jgi:hypothetical protein
MRTRKYIGPLTFVLIIGIQMASLYSEQRFFRQSMDINRDRLREELTAAKMPDNQVEAIGEAMIGLEFGITSYVRGVVGTLCTIDVFLILLMVSLFEMQSQQTKGTPE